MISFNRQSKSHLMYFDSVTSEKKEVLYWILAARSDSRWTAFARGYFR